MFHTASDYAINKLDPDAIVYRCATGEAVRITRTDFDSDEEFEIWKSWSDADYHETERRDRAYNDRRTAIAAALYLEEQDTNWLAMELKAAAHGQRTQLVERMSDFLTDTQFKRLWLRFAEGREYTDIAAAEGVSVTDVACTVYRAIRRLKLLRRCKLL